MKIVNITVDNDHHIELKNLVVIVGPNGSGKTRFLDELHSVITGRGRNSNFWNINVNQVQIDRWDKKLWCDSLIQHQKRENQMQWFSPFAFNQTSPDGMDISQQEYDDIVKCLLSDFFKNEMVLRKELTHFLSVDHRLNVQQSVQIQGASQKPSGMLEILQRNVTLLLPKISDLLRELFSKKLIVSCYDLPLMELIICDQGAEEPPKFILEDRTTSFQNYLNWKRDNKVCAVNQEGHGVRAFLHILLTYFLPTNRILMIDEPEIHLYPSVKRKFGNKIGLLSKEAKKQVFCVTHDSDFLQGIFDANCSFTLLRLAKLEKTHLCYLYQHKQNLTAGKNQNEYLQIPFLDCVIIVEGATDRIIYEHVFRDNNLLVNKEYKFISAGGKDSLHNPEALAIETHTPFAIIVDIDALKLNQKNDSIICRLTVVSKDDSLKKSILAIGEKLTGIKDLKQKGIDVIDNLKLQSEARDIIDKLKEKGVFIVPVGTLESWGDIQSSKHDFVEQFIEKY